MDNSETPSGVGGWLYVLIFIMFIAGLINIINMGNYFEVTFHSSGNKFIKPIINTPWWWYAFSGVCSFAAGYILWKFHTWKFLRTALVLIWIPFIFLPVLVLVFIFIYVDAVAFDNIKFEPKIVRSGFIFWMSQAMESLWFNVICTAYLLTSKRVRNTYPRL